MKNLIVMCAIPGSGKSTWIKENKDNLTGCTCVVSRDEIRFSLVAEDEPYFSKEKEVFEKYIKDIAAGLNNADNVIADATHINPSSRAKLFNALNKYYPLKDLNIIAMVIDSSKAIEQNELRKGTRSYVPSSAMNSMKANYEMPILEEGFNRIMFYKDGKYLME